MPVHPLQIAGVAIVGVAAVLAAIDLFSESSSQEQHYSYQSNQSNHSFQNSTSSSSLFRSWGEKSQGNGGEKSSKPEESSDKLDILDQILYEQQPEERQEPRSLNKRQEWLSRLIDMGFSRISCIQALEYCGNFNDALEYLLQLQSNQLDDYPKVKLVEEIPSISLSDHPNSEENLRLSVTHPPLTPSSAIEIYQLPGSFIHSTDQEEKDQETPFHEIHTKLNDSECFDIQLVTVSDAESIVEQLTNADSKSFIDTSDEWDMVSTASDP